MESLSQMEESPAVLDYKFLLFYHYVDIAEPQALCDQQIEICKRLGLNGRIRVAEEGINGMIGGSTLSVQEYITTMDSLKTIHNDSTAPIHWKISGLVSSSSPESQMLTSLSVKTTKEVVSLDLPADVRKAVVATETGVHLSPQEFHEQLSINTSSAESRENFRLLDIRNHYEVKIGTFEVKAADGETVNAINPMTRAFSDTTKFLRDNIDDLKGKKVFMYCTGGVRCERAGSYLRYLGVDEVYQLFGGIHNYQCSYPDGGHFKGKNFVFDPRIAIPSSEAALSDDSIMFAQPSSSAAAEQSMKGHCQSCSCIFDDYSSKSRCPQCRMLILICNACRDSCEENMHSVLCDICRIRTPSAK